MTTPMTPNPDNPHRAQVGGFEGREFSAVFSPGATLRYLREDGSWAVPPSAGGGTVWGGITGVLSNQTDLQAALDAKANSSSISSVGFSGAYADLTGKPTLGTVSPINLSGNPAQFLKGDGTWGAGGGGAAVWGSITGTLSDQTDLQNALNLKANLVSPTFTGTPLGPTAAVNTSTTQLATTAFVIGQAGDSNPLMNGVESSGASPRYSRMDHVHPSDTTKMTNPMTTAGDIIIATTAGAPVRLGAGSSGQVLTLVSGAPAWQTPSGGGGSPGGSDTSVQYNNAGAFGGDSTFTYNGTALGVPATINGPTSALTFSMPSAAAGLAMTITSGASTGASSNAGNLNLKSGAASGTTSTGGNIVLQTGGGTAGAGRIDFITGLTARLALNNNGSIAVNGTTGTAGQILLTNGSGAAAAWSRGAPILLTSRTADYTFILGDANGGVYHPTTDANNRTFTIPANASVAYPVGTTLTFVNDANTMTIAINTDTLVLAGTGSTGSRTLAANGMATALKVDSTRWLINGTGLT